LSNKKLICIISQSHICRNPRVLKEAITLAGANYAVQIITNSIAADLHREDLSLIKNHPNISLSIISDLYQSGAFTDRLSYKLGRLLNKYLNIETSLSLGYGARRYYKIGKAINADLYICHQELGTYIGTKLIANGYKVAFDFEDWYSEDLLPAARKERPINLLRKIESIALKTGVFCITTSNALANKLSKKYICIKPLVIYNAFTTRPDLTGRKKTFDQTLKLFWFSQTIGSGRGLEQFIGLSHALKKSFEIHLLGNITEHYRDKLNSLLPKQHQLYYHDLVPDYELADKIAQFDIGLALELDTPKSRNYTITNKFFQYIQAGLPVITSETDGQNEGFDGFKPGIKIAQNPPDDEISALEAWLNHPLELQSARNRAIEAAGFYNWEKESGKLLALVNKTLE
jgi:glycosyltransferase involved in cell wall biosynthesis